MASEDLSWLAYIGGDLSSSESTSSSETPLWLRCPFSFESNDEKRKLTDDDKEEEKQEILTETKGNIMQREARKITRIQEKIIIQQKGIYYIQNVPYINVHEIIQI